MTCDICKQNNCDCVTIHPDTLTQTTCDTTALCHKVTNGKPDLHIVDVYFGNALICLSEVVVQAVPEYGYNTIDKVPVEEYEKALRRHQIAKAKGEVLDPKSGKPHSWHIATNGMIIAEIEQRKKLAGD